MLSQELKICHIVLMDSSSRTRRTCPGFKRSESVCVRACLCVGGGVWGEAWCEHAHFTQPWGKEYSLFRRFCLLHISLILFPFLLPRFLYPRSCELFLVGILFFLFIARGWNNWRNRRYSGNEMLQVRDYNLIMLMKCWLLWFTLDSKGKEIYTRSHVIYEPVIHYLLFGCQCSST